MQEEMRMHRKLIDGLYTGDPDKMEDLMREHLALTRKFYLSALQQGGEGERIEEISVDEQKSKQKD